MGMDLPRRGGNIVIDELHFTTSLYMYKELEKKGVELRIVKHRNWAIDVNDMDHAIDRNTRLVSLALVSNVNGFMHDGKAVSALAHARGAYLFADIIQAVGAVPIDVKALGIDFASAGTYKWLMGERGIGFLYVREDLQGTVLPTTRYGHRQVANFNRAELTWEPLPGAAKYETGGIGVLLAACVSEGIDYVQRARPRQDPRARAPADRSPADRAAAARLQAAHAARNRDADSRVRAERRRRDREGAAGRQSRRDHHRQRKPAAAVGLGVQHARGHRPRRRGIGEDQLAGSRSLESSSPISLTPGTRLGLTRRA